MAKASALRRRIYQAGYTVADRDAAIRYWIDVMGAGPFYVADIELPMKYRGTELPTRWKVAHGFCDELFIELIEPAPGPSIYRETINCSGYGLHHLMIRGSSYDELLEDYLSRGCTVAASHDSEAARFCYLDGGPLAANFIELYDMPPIVVQLFDGIAAAHRGWDGHDPVRPLF